MPYWWNYTFQCHPPLFITHAIRAMESISKNAENIYTLNHIDRYNWKSNNVTECLELTRLSDLLIYHSSRHSNWNTKTEASQLVSENKSNNIDLFCSVCSSKYLILATEKPKHLDCHCHKIWITNGYENSTWILDSFACLKLFIFNFKADCINRISILRKIEIEFQALRCSVNLFYVPIKYA